MPKKSEGAPIPVGTLVRVKPNALKRGMYIPVNSNAVAEHGWLWFVEETRPWTGSQGSRSVYVCKSLATGDTYEWFPHEIEEGKE